MGPGATELTTSLHSANMDRKLYRCEAACRTQLNIVWRIIDWDPQLHFSWCWAGIEMKISSLAPSLSIGVCL